MVTEVSGTITTNTVWSGEILLTGSVLVQEGVTLTIDPGTKVMFQHNRDYRLEHVGLEIHGTLNAVGTEANRIWFTSDAADPQNGDWQMLRLFGNTGSIMDYTIVEFAKQGLNMWESDALIQHSIFRWNNWEGIYLEQASTATIQDNLIYQNGYNGLAMEQFNDVDLIRNIFSQNGSHGVHIDASTAMMLNNILTENGYSGFSVDNNSTLVAITNTSINNNDTAFQMGEGSFSITLTNNTLSPNAYAVEIPAALLTSNGAEMGIVELLDVLGLDLTPYDLGYTPGDQVLDQFDYVYGDDYSRQIIHQHGATLGLTWSVTVDGDTIWAATLSGEISQIDIATGAVLKTLTAPSVQPWGMAFDGQDLWITDFAEKRTYKIDTTTGAELFSFANPDQDSGAKGLTYDGQYLYIMGWESSEIYKMQTDGTLVDTIPLQGGGGGGLAWDGEFFWVPDGNQIKKFTADGDLVGSIYGASETTWDLSWDATRELLWATQRSNENWHEAPRLFSFEILDDRVKIMAFDGGEITGSALNERINGNKLAIEAYAKAGDDIVIGSKQADILDGGTGIDMLRGGKGADTLSGSGGKDRLYGGNGKDLLLGGNGKDALFGGGGNDRLEGGGGKGDAMFGQGGRDTFVFRLGDAADRVGDFTDDIDRLMLDEALWGGGMNRAQVVAAFAAVDDNDVVFDFGNGDVLTVQGVGSVGTGIFVNDIVFL